MKRERGGGGTDATYVSSQRKSRHIATAQDCTVRQHSQGRDDGKTR